MKATFQMENLGCASCAAKMEQKISQLSGVSGCSVNFMTEKLVIEGDEGQMPRIVEEARRIVRRIEPKAGIKA